ncbi:phosphoribosyl-AMP cyclohydrolase [Candidatus Vidania fulgoroideorum]
MIYPAIIQNKNNKVLMLGYVNRMSIKTSLKIGYIVFYSRKRLKFWIKGETSTNFMLLLNSKIDCDKDSYLFVVKQINNISCHKGTKSCFK